MGDLRTTLNVDRAAVARQLERERHKPVGDPMTEDEARKLTDRIKFAAEQLWDQIVEAYNGRADVALGYDSWDVYCSTEFGSLRLRLPREERVEMVRSLRQSGLSNRAIASATGISEGTVRNDLAAQNCAPDEDELTEQLIAREPWFTPVTGLDGKTYPPNRPRISGGGTTYTVVRPQLRGGGTTTSFTSYRAAQVSDAETFDGELAELDRGIDVMMRLIDHGQLSEDERTILAGRVADYSGRLQVIAHKLRGE